jgi:guanine nucleotide-binding protein G(t) subunit alpha 3
MSFTLSYHQEIGEKLSDIDGRLDYPLLNKELVLDVKRLWQDPAIQVKTNSHSNLLKLYSFPGQVC